MKFTAEHMRQYCENNPLVSVRKQAPNTTILKYKNKVFYRNLWTPELCEFRGTVVDDDWNIVQRPFTKIFNYGEKNAPKIHRNEPVIAVRKVNGFMAAATVRDKKEFFVSTTGSTSSDFVELAINHLNKQPIIDMLVGLSEITAIFEIVDPSDPHVIPENVGAHLLGFRLKDWNAQQHLFSESHLDELALESGVHRPEWKAYSNFQDVKNDLRNINHEGFVVRDYNGNELKMKSPYYLVTKFLGRKTQEKLDQIISNPEEAKKIIDEEFYSVLDYLSTRKDDFINMSEQERFSFVREYFDNEIIK